ncbi:MAG: P-loop NTPase [Erythrobacter sp.]
MSEETSSNLIESPLRAALSEAIIARVNSAKMVAGRAVVIAEAGDLNQSDRTELEAEIRAALGVLDGVNEVRVALTGERVKRRMIAIGSGKGGVGKSTLTTNLAVALAKMGRSVGVIDSDIYGPSQPRMLGTDKAEVETVGQQLVPISTPYGVKMLSMGNLVAQGKALAWRGLMAGKALAQLLDARWDDTDLLLVDLPPGTGDVQLSMLKEHRPDGAVLVSTPQDIALLDAARAGQLFDQGEVPIIGLVENMSGYACPHCSEVSDPFGQGGVEKFATALEIPFLGRIPLNLDIRIQSDAGVPPASGDNANADSFHAIAQHLSDWLDGRTS